MKSNEKGLTLIEILVSVAILGIAVISFSTLSSYTGLASKKSDDSTAALLIAESVINELRNAKPEEIQTLINHYNEQSQYVSEKYAVYVSQDELIASDASYTFQPNSLRKNIVSTIGIVNINNLPYVLVVSVSWQGES